MKVIVTKPLESILPEFAGITQIAHKGVRVRNKTSGMTISLDVSGDHKQVKEYAKKIRKNIPGVRVHVSRGGSTKKGDAPKASSYSCVKCPENYVFNPNSTRCIKDTGKRARKLGIGKAPVKSPKKSALVRSQKKAPNAAKKQVRFADLILPKKKKVSQTKNVQLNALEPQPPQAPQNNTFLPLPPPQPAAPPMTQARPQIVAQSRPQNVKPERACNNKLRGKVFVFAGFKDAMLQNEITRCGGRVDLEVTRNTNYVVYGGKNPFDTREYKDAGRFNTIKRIEYKSLVGKLGISV